jgi:hypothetical protein
VERRRELPPDTTLLIGEPETPATTNCSAHSPG